MMAKKAGKPKVSRRRRKQEMSGFGPILFITIGALAVFKYEAALLVAAGLVPTIVLGFTGKGENKNEKLQCVSFTNLSGIMPMIPDVWARPSSVYNFIGDPMNLLVMWGAAAFGYALVYVGPMLASMLLQMLAKDRLKNIVQQKQGLVELWGSEVLGDRDDLFANTPKRPGAR